MRWHQSRWAQAILTSAVSWFGSPRHPPRFRRWLQLEPLESRCVPTTLTPTTFADGGLGSGSLRDAALQSTADAGPDAATILLEAGTYARTTRNSARHHATARTSR